MGIWVFVLALIAFVPVWGQGKCSLALAQSRGAVKVIESAVDMAPGRKVFYRYHRHPKSKKTILFISGLVYPLSQSKTYVEKMAEEYNVVEVAFSTQLESLKALEGEKPDFYRDSDIVRTPKDFAEEIKVVTQAIGLKKKFYLVSLSYSSIAIEYAMLFPKRLHFYQPMAPLVSSSAKVGVPGLLLENSTKFGRAWASMVDPLNIWGTRDYIEKQKLNILKQAAYQLARESSGAPALEAIPFAHFKEAVWKMIEATAEFDLRNYLTSELPPIKLILAEGESGSLLADQFDFWRSISQKQDKAQLIVIEQAQHDLTGAHPESSAAVTKALIENRLKDKEVSYDSGSFLPIQN